MQTIRLAIFDWDGTLMDSVGRIVACVAHAARDCGEPVPTAVETHQIIGLSLEVGIPRLFALEQGSERANALIARYRHHYVHDSTPSPLFAGARELLQHWHEQGWPWRSPPASHGVDWTGYWMIPGCGRSLPPRAGRTRPTPSPIP